MVSNGKTAGKKIALLTGAAGVAVVAFLVLRSRGVDPRQIGEWLAGAGDRWWAPVAFIGLYALFNTTLLPATALTLTAGVVWGWFVGGLWVLAASTIGSAIPYWIAWSGSGWVEEVMSRKAPRMLGALKKEGFMTLLLLRLIPVIPYNILNYVAGLACIRPREYLAATFIGTIPGIFIFTWLASSIAAGLVSPRQAFVRILIAGALLAALAIVSRFFSDKVRARLHA
ncbi:MAG TPA: TVP38/TMEM64 family protein [Thermoanaerobaculia bacterium]|nr:TVP38/TMEM64 family protein [Thermoanaerobaculia bacterium]